MNWRRNAQKDEFAKISVSSVKRSSTREKGCTIVETIASFVESQSPKIEKKKINGGFVRGR